MVATEIGPLQGSCLPSCTPSQQDLAMETYHEIDMREEIAKLKVELDTERSKGA